LGAPCGRIGCYVSIQRLLCFISFQLNIIKLVVGWMFSTCVFIFEGPVMARWAGVCNVDIQKVTQKEGAGAGILLGGCFSGVVN
jgi:hypothetical protein